MNYPEYRDDCKYLNEYPNSNLFTGTINYKVTSNFQFIILICSKNHILIFSLDPCLLTYECEHSDGRLSYHGIVI